MDKIKRALRRFNTSVIKAKRKTYWYGKFLSDSKQIGKLVHTSTFCSCWMCGNPRKHYKGKLVNELTHKEFASRKIKDE